MISKYQTYQLARFIQEADFSDLDQTIINQLKKHLLDSIASMLHCVDSPAVGKLCLQTKKMGEGGPCLAPSIGKIAPDRAAQLFTAMIRYPDFMDNFLGKEATCHPSDNIGSLFAAAQLRKISSKDFLLAMAIGYSIECRMVEEIPVMVKGFDHTVLLAYSVTAAICKLLGLDEAQTANALAMSGCSFNPLVTSRASYTYEWKGFASSMVAMGCMNIALLAAEGMTGPVAIFEGPKGFNEVFDMKLQYDWSKEDFSLIHKCILKEYNAEVHTQSAIEAILDLRDKLGGDYNQVENIDVTIFLTAYHIVGGGAYGDRSEVFSKEQADHSLPYVLAAALLDGTLYPEQLLPERINRADVQHLLKKVKVHTASPVHKPIILAGILDPYTEAYPEKVPARVEITLNNKKKLDCKKEDYYGFFTRPMSWEDVVVKFKKLTNHLSPAYQDRIINTINDLENRELSDLIRLIAGSATEELKTLHYGMEKNEPAT